MILNTLNDRCVLHMSVTDVPILMSTGEKKKDGDKSRQI